MARVQRRTRGTGSLYQRASDGMWCVTVELEPVGGKRRRKVIARARKVDAQAELRKALKAAAAGALRTSTPTLEQWIEEWWSKHAATNLKVTNVRSYRNDIANYITPYLGNRRLDRIDIGTIEDWQQWLIAPKPEGAGVSKRTSLKAHQILSGILQYAVKREKLDRNVAQIADKPKPAKRKMPQLTTDEARRLLAAHDPGDETMPMLYAMLATAFWIGPRPSELIGITRDSFNAETGDITISWQVQPLTADHGCGEKVGDRWPCGKTYGAVCPKKVVIIPENQEARHLDGMSYLVRPKTPSSWRSFRVPEPLRLVLAAYIEQTVPGIEGLMFSHQDRGGRGRGSAGRPVRVETWNAMWRKALGAIDVSGPTPHSARKTCNTILRDLGVPVDVRKLILGHASEEVNEAVYTHTSDQRVIDAMGAIGSALTRAGSSVG